MKFIRFLYVCLTTFLLLGLTPATSYAGISVVRAVPGPGKLFVVAVGVNQYPAAEGSVASLGYAEDDANAIATVLTERPRFAFTAVSVERLIGRDATLNSLRATLREVAAKAGPNDTLIFYFAGNGFKPRSSDENDFVFMLSDSRDPRKSPHAGVLHSQEFAQLLYQIPTQKQIILLDSCDTKAALDAIREGLDGNRRSLLQQADRRVALIGVDGVALENSELKHGVFTFCILEALNGAADVDHKGLITEARLEGYLTWRVSEQAHGDENLYSYSTLRNLALVRPAPIPSIAPPPATENMRGSELEPDTSSGNGLGTDYVLLVATDHYSAGWDTLPNPIADARALRAELISKYGYSDDAEHTVAIEEVSENAFLDEVKRLRTVKFGPQDRLLVYFAGHGIRDKEADEGYIVFNDTLPPALDPYHRTALPYGYLSTLLNGIGVPHLMLIIDSCYGGTFAATGDFKNLLSRVNLPQASREKLIVRYMRAESRIYLTSGDEHHAVSDGAPGEHSPFASALLSILDQNAQQGNLLHAADLYLDLQSLPSEPRSGYFFPGASESGADFLFIPRRQEVAAAGPPGASQNLE